MHQAICTQRQCFIPGLLDTSVISLSIKQNEIEVNWWHKINSINAIYNRSHFFFPCYSQDYSCSWFSVTPSCTEACCKSMRRYAKEQSGFEIFRRFSTISFFSLFSFKRNQKKQNNSVGILWFLWHHWSLIYGSKDSGQYVILINQLEKSLNLSVSLSLYLFS